MSYLLQVLAAVLMINVALALGLTADLGINHILVIIVIFLLTGGILLEYLPSINQTFIGMFQNSKNSKEQTKRYEDAKRDIAKLHKNAKSSAEKFWLSEALDSLFAGFLTFLKKDEEEQANNN